jgi:hypothetical protein
MTDIEKQIEAMGYEVHVSDMSNEYIVCECIIQYQEKKIG